MLFPIGDDDRSLDGTAYVTLLLVIANVLVFGYQIANPEFTYGWSIVPAQITTGQDFANTQPLFEEAPNRAITSPDELPQRAGPGPAPLIYLTIFTAMFMHGGVLHLLGNLLYLWIFGDNVEHRFGHGAFLGFYLVSGLVASAAQIALDPDSLILNLGASGAISGVLGAYLVLFPRNRVHAVFFFVIVTLPAFAVLLFWIALQFFNGYGALVAAEQTGGVAYAAHIGGFLAGVAMGIGARIAGLKERRSPLSGAIARDPHARRLW